MAVPAAERHLSGNREDLRRLPKRKPDHCSGVPKHWFDSHAHTHVALDDAIEQGALFCNMLVENLGKSQCEPTLSIDQGFCRPRPSKQGIFPT